MAGQRANYFQFLRSEIEHFNQIETCIEGYGLDKIMLELVKLRVSQVNGCSFCVLLHTRRLRLLGESNERIDMVAVWPEARCFSDKEAAALRWAEAVTQLAGTKRVGDELYRESEAVFGQDGLSRLTLAVAMINNWNRLAVSFHTDHQYVDHILKAFHPESAAVA